MEYSLCTDQREEEGRTEAQIGYLRMSEFFMYDRDPEKVETYRKMMEKSELVKWNLMHGMYAYGAKDPVGYVKKVRKFTLKGIGDKVTQDMLILAGRDDHMIMPSLFCEEFDLLPNVRSLALQMYSNMDDAGNHCNMGNMKLALDTMVRWMDQMDDKNGTSLPAIERLVRRTVAPMV